MTPENKRHSHDPNNNVPDWAQRERGRDMRWIGENLHILWPAATAAFKEQGRGALVVDTTLQPVPGRGNPFAYFSQVDLEPRHDEDINRMVREYGPEKEFVVVLLKSVERTSAYRVQVRPHQQSEGKE